MNQILQETASLGTKPSGPINPSNNNIDLTRLEAINHMLEQTLEDAKWRLRVVEQIEQILTALTKPTQGTELV